MSPGPSTGEHPVARTPLERVAVALESLALRQDDILGELRSTVVSRLFRCAEAIIAKKDGAKWIFAILFLLVGFASGVLASRGWYQPTQVATPSEPSAPTSVP